MKSFAVLVVACIVTVQAGPARGPRGGQQGGPPGGPPSLSAEVKADITALATSSAITNQTLKDALSKGSTSQPPDIRAMMDSLIEIAAKNAGGSQAEWDKAKALALNISSSAGPFAGGPGSGPPPRPGQGGRPGGGGSGGGGGGGGGPPPPPGSPMEMSAMIPIKICQANLRQNAASQEQKDTYAQMVKDFEEYKTANRPTPGQMPDMTANLKNDVAMVEKLRTYADKLSASGYTCLSDAMAEGRQITRESMSKALTAYLTSVSALGITAPVDKIKTLSEQTKANGGLTTESVNSMVTYLNEIKTALTEKQASATNETKTQIQMLSLMTDGSIKLMTAFAPYADRMKAALNG